MGDVDRAVRERQRERIGLDDLDPGLARQPRTGDGQHVEVDVGRNGLPATAGEGDGHVARSGSHVQDTSGVATSDQSLDRADARLGAARKPVEAREIRQVGLDLGSGQAAGVEQLDRIGPGAEGQQAAHADGHVGSAPRRRGDQSWVPQAESATRAAGEWTRR